MAAGCGAEGLSVFGAWAGFWVGGLAGLAVAGVCFVEVPAGGVVFSAAGRTV
jgi:hypothetical protein